MATGPSPTTPTDPTSGRPMFCPRCTASCGVVPPGTTVRCADCGSVFTFGSRDATPRPDFSRPSAEANR